MKPLAALAALTVAFATTLAPALARTSYVVDDAHLLSQNAVSQINQRVGDFNAQTSKEIVVVIEPSLNGATPDAAIERSFAQQQVNGVEIFIAQKEHQIRIAGDTASRRFFPSGSFQTIAQSMRDSFRTGDYDGGVENAVGLIINQYRSHAGSLPRARAPAGVPAVSRGESGGMNLSWIWWLIILAVIFFVIRGIFRAMAGPRMMPPGYGGPGYGGPGYGGPGYGGPGYGGGGFGGGGGFFSGLLGGLGGAWLGNELFGGRRDEGFGGGVAGTGFDPGTNQDASGWQSDPGQIDTSNIGGTDWGGGGGDFGGGGDSGGGWGGGDSGGGGSSGDGGW